MLAFWHVALPSSSNAPMYYGERPPGGRLAPYVHAYWHFRVVDDTPSIQHHVPPDGAISLYTTATAA